MANDIALTGAQLDRAVGALVGLATGDALGAPYEFTTPGRDADIEMRSGGTCGWETGEWTDDTAMAVGIAEVTATGGTDPVAIGQRFLDWLASGPKDAGISTRSVLNRAGTPEGLPEAAAAFYAEHRDGAAGNGSLMRTAPVALAHLGDDEAIARHARAISSLTHADPLAAEACVLWCVAIDRAVRERQLDVRAGLPLLEPDRAAAWEERIAEAETADPFTLTPNGFVVTAFQAAWAVVSQTPVPDDDPRRHLEDALRQAVRIGHDTDTVAAIAGQLLGAYWGVSAIPWQWRRHLHGWPGMNETDLVRLAVVTARRGASDEIGWPTEPRLVGWGLRNEHGRVVCEPLLDADEYRGQLLIGNLPGLPAALERGAGAVVSLSRLGPEDVPDDVEHVHFWLVDQDPPEANPNVEFVLADAADAVEQLRAEGHTVYLHCVGGRSRTAAVAALVLMRREGIGLDAAWERVADTLGDVRENPTLLRALADLSEGVTV